MEKNNNIDLFLDLFDEQNFYAENSANGTTKEAFERRKAIDRKNLEEIYIGPLGMRWDMYGECKICGKECRRRCEKCPWIFYCCREHQIEDWPEHKKNCKNIDWGDDGVARAGKDLAAGVDILERSTIFVSPRYHTEHELSQLTSDDYAQSDGTCLRPCFGCHMLIPPYFNTTFVCSECKFPMHSTACEGSNWHVNECEIFKKLCVQDWYDDIGYRRDIMTFLAVLRGVLLKHSKPMVWSQIMSMESETIYLTSTELKNSIMYFILDVCQVDGVQEDDIVKFLSIFMKQRLNCCMPCSANKRLVSVLCSGIIPFTLVSDQNANVHGGVLNHRMRMIFRTKKPVAKGEFLTIGRGGL